MVPFKCKLTAGERDPKILASYREPSCKNSQEIIEAALTGNYRAEHLFSLQQALELYDIFQTKLNDCDREIEKKLATFETHALMSESLNQPNRNKQKKSKNAPTFDLGSQLRRITGIDLMDVPGMNSLTTLYLIGEIGLDMTRWKNAKQFSSWLGLCPGNKVSGGKIISGKSKPSANKAASILRMAASTLYRNSTALGAYLRRLKSRLGAPKAITATAHKIARIIYNMLRYGTPFKEAGQDYYEQQYRDRVLRNLKRKAEELGFSLVEAPKMVI